MFILGLYLFVVLIVTFISESRVLIGLCSLGWVFPAILVSIYALLRGFAAKDDSDTAEYLPAENDNNHEL